ncbi:MAG: radical SAM protein [Spirochaetes bacterium RBG_16_49_21]|nr:MAG: radical SAM protein [Spirochaetes bacterium RBG_16_49_21]
MDCREQLDILQNIGDCPAFAERIEDTIRSPLRAAAVDILQLNIGKRCNLLCKHCHVGAGPHRTEAMSRLVLEQCLAIAGDSGISTIDVTGGSPEMNPHLEWFLDEAAMLNRRLMVRSNCAILLEEGYERFIDIYAANRVEIVTSLPDWREQKTDAMRGRGIFAKILEAMKRLNRRGYGAAGSGLILDIVHNPAGAYLPGSQDSLEHEYRLRLAQDHSVSFNSLYCITNIPIGRYLEFLIRSGNYSDYIRDLCGAYNPAAVERVMCKTTLSVGWDGTLYDCDFNQMLDLPVDHGAPNSVFDFDLELLRNRPIVVNNHCYGCVAGAGSSCQGTITA